LGRNLKLATECVANKAGHPCSEEATELFEGETPICSKHAKELRELLNEVAKIKDKDGYFMMYGKTWQTTRDT
jgi:hypothetical protein